MDYFGRRENINDFYLNQVFYWAFRSNLKLPVYQISSTDSTKNILDKNPFVLMVTGNENHQNLDHYYEDDRVVAMIKNYPYMENCDSDHRNQSYKIKYSEDRKRLEYVVQKEDLRTLNIPLGYCNDFIPYNFCQRKFTGGFIGQHTEFRENAIKNINYKFIDNNFSHDNPFCFAMYSGFGPFVYGPKGSLDGKHYSKELANFMISFCFGGQSPETFRFFESAASGCVIFSPPMPDVWYYNKCPAFFFPEWRSDWVDEAIDIIKEKESDYRDAVTQWHNDFIHPAAVGKLVAIHVMDASK